MRHHDETPQPSGERGTTTRIRLGEVVLLIKSAVAYGLIFANAISGVCARSYVSEAAAVDGSLGGTARVRVAQPLDPVNGVQSAL